MEEKITNTMNVLHITVKFSKEIAFWGDKNYYENPKFMEFWDKRNSMKRFKDNIWWTGYCNPRCMEEAAQGKLEVNTVRFLYTIGGSKVINISPTMNVFLVHDPSKFHTTHEVGLYDFAMLCRECAIYCGGTVEITYPKKQRFFKYPTVENTTIKLGTGIRKMKVNEPKARKKMKEEKI